MNGILLMAQGRTGDAISQQVRDEINAAREEARAAAQSGRDAAAGTPVPPGGSLSIPFDPNQGPPASVVGISIAFFLTVGAILIFWPIARAFARRMDRASPASKLPPEVSGQLAQLTQAVDAIALEVERISEGQRFTTRLLSEQRGDQSRTVLSPVAGGDPRPGPPG